MTNQRRKVSSAHIDRIADTNYSSFWVAVIHTLTSDRLHTMMYNASNR